jgi:hypothetical protein
LHQIKISRCRVDPGDNLTDLFLDGRCYSSLEATTYLVLEKCPNIRRFPYYHWDISGIFRNTRGPFKWYFQLKDDAERTERSILIEFSESIDFENESSGEIFRKLQGRLNTLCSVINEYQRELEQTQPTSMLLAFEPEIEGTL